MKKKMKFLVLPNSDHVTCHIAEERGSSFDLLLQSVCEQTDLSGTTSNLTLYGTSMAMYLALWIILKCVTQNVLPE